MSTTRDGANGLRPRPPRRAVRSIALAVAVLLLGPLLAVAASPASPAAALTPQPIPDDLWDIEPRPPSVGYAVIEGEDGDPVTGGQDFEYTNIPGAAFDPDPGESTNLLTLLHGEDGDSFLITISVPQGEPRVQRGFYPDVSARPAEPGHLGMEVIRLDPDGPNVQCEGEVTGWVAIDHMREVDDQLGEIDYRFEQSCDGAPPLRARIHVDVIPESIYGPDPIPDDLWDVDPPGVEGQDYVVVEGAEGDPQTQGADTLYIGSGFGVGSWDDGIALLLSTGPQSAWTGSWSNHAGRGQVEPGFYPVHMDKTIPGPIDPPYMGWWRFEAEECTVTDGWFAVDEISFDGDLVETLDLRLEQSCDGGPPIRAKIHVDRTPNPRPMPEGLWDGRPEGVTGDYFYVEGVEGDPLTGGVDTIVQSGEAVVVAGDQAGSIEVFAPVSPSSEPPDYWGAVFGGVDELVQPGYYGNISKFTAEEPQGGTIEVGHQVDGGWAECPEPQSGWYVVDSVTRIDGAIARLDLRWGQKCGDGPTVHGRIHIDRGGLPAGSPIGELEPFVLRPDGVGVEGWALDPETVAPIEVTYTVDGVPVSTQLANADAPEVADLYPLYGAAHGISADISVPMGTHQVCATAKNVGVGTDTVLGCRSVTITSGPPTGAFDVARAVPGGVVVGGWALDPDTSASIPVHVYVGSKGVALTADGTRPDVGAAYPGYGSNHGFNASIQAPPGTHQVCAYAINAGRGPANTFLGCKAVTVPGGSPFGSLDAARGVPGGVVVGGWALDPDTAASIPVHVYAGTKGVALTASGNRPDVGAFFAPYGSAHGFDGFIPVPPGAHQVCAYAINVGVGATTTLACRTVVVPGGSPFGSFDLAMGGAGKVTVAGWAIDPDTAASIPVHVYVGNAGTALTAGNVRNDVAAAFPGYGSTHGFNATITATPGVKQVCAYGINTGVGGNSLLGCKTVTIT